MFRLAPVLQLKDWNIMERVLDPPMEPVRNNFILPISRKKRSGKFFFNASTFSKLICITSKLKKKATRLLLHKSLYTVGIGTIVRVRCFPCENYQPIYGSNPWYTDDSDVCAAAIHAGIYFFGERGTNEIEFFLKIYIMLQNVLI